ncbi:class I SAM-dependent methyltransferase [Dethiosulfatarculus sandiegensis]|uniref:SAM-dependent methyltransferase n=1 Tax=Dethiosulfatarculus sandiegensis TaxID=1429043 RepID=A0A0D2GKM1_9BACT|nr:class I SAM-dependent methyltransferase [Dethiosulfatarculus sandiegensis]KIX15307.1 SAM-dependent methyltransferase [Dethiosulfatarculus sandiegensis]
MRENSDLMIFHQIRELANLKNKTVLEIGCGDGRITSLLAKEVKSLTAVDPDDACLERARQAVLGVDFQVGSGEELKFQDRHFDLVIFTLSLHHQDSVKALTQAERVIKDQGAILVLEPVPEGEIEKICEVVDAEAHKKHAAQKAIGRSGLFLKHSTIFKAQWIFDDLSNLWAWLADYYQTTINTKMKKEILATLGKRPKEPLLVGDLMIAQLLFKPGV